MIHIITLSDAVQEESRVYMEIRHGRQVVKWYFPKYIDKVVIIEIKQTCHTVLVTLGGYFNMFLFVLKTFSGWRNGALEMVCRDNTPPFFLCNVTKSTFPRDVFNL